MRGRDWLVVVLAAVLLAAGPAVGYSHSVALVPEDIFHVYWEFDENSITFEIQAQTLGWVGFGISLTGGMEDADIVTGWIKDGTPYFQDRYSTGNGVPSIDVNQDWELLFATENSTHTILAVKRYRNLCDQEDLDITASTMRLIWAFGTSDPDTEAMTYADYHNSNRGSRSVQLVSFIDTSVDLPDDIFPIDFLARNVSVPTDTTTYWCESFELPALAEKHHIVKIEPIVQSGHEGLVHHILIYACYGTVNQAEVNQSGICYTASMPTFDACTAVLVAWAIGAEDFYYPEHVGYPIGGGNPPQYIRMEIHYDNPMGLNSYMDSSGIRLWVTPTLRQYDSAVLQVGVIVGFQFIPHQQEERVLNTGWCPGACTTEGLAAEPNGIKIFSLFLHTHVVGVALRVRHYRNGVELPLIDEDTHYDFNYQEARTLPEEVTVLPGDDIEVECYYDTKDSTNTVVGGLATENEMCLVFLQYYPKVALADCMSAPSPADIGTVYDGTVTFDGSDFVFAAPPTLAGQRLGDVLYLTDWPNEPIRVSDLHTVVTTGQIMPLCRLDEDTAYSVNFVVIDQPEVTVPLAVEPAQCYGTGGSDITAHARVALIILAAATAICTNV